MKTARLVAPIVVGFLLGAGRLPAQENAAKALAQERAEQTGTAITILFDNSGSMQQENKLQQAKSAFRAWLEKIPADTKLSLITFEGHGRLNVPMGAGNRELIAQKVAQLEARTSTPICGALEIARGQIEQRRREVTPYERHVVLVFTDGQETEDRRGIEGVREEITALRAQSVEVVGIGFHGQGDYMSDVATRFTLANDEAELKQGLAKVDAEIGGADDLVVTPEDLAALKKFQPAAPAPILTTPTESAPAEPPPATVAKAHGLNANWIIVAVIVIVILRILGRKKRRS